ncbi:O-antigen ligase family protein [Demetria terragena]|uniref:O-antigen ligase family protein n=1 Tax=Demetria terragena TaxID=63959 RepID=UPI00035DE76F|nr:O-antigen ligase family protein [Demetria terragena]
MIVRQFLTRLALAITAALALLGLAALGYLLPSHQTPVLVLVALAAIWAIGLTDPALIALATISLIFVPARLGAAGVDLTVSDLALVVGLIPLLVSAPRPFSAPMRTMLWLSVGYQVAIAFTVILHPTRSGIVEWFHEWALVSGALLIGWTIGRADRARAGAVVLSVTGLALALLVIAQGLRQLIAGNLAPVYLSWPVEFHKNFAGSLLCAVALVGYAHPHWSGLSRRFGLFVFWVCTTGIAFTQSRQALIGLAVGVTILVLRADHTVLRRRSQLIFLAVIPVLAAVSVLVRDQLRSGNEFNSANQRLDWFADSFDVWQTDYLFGAGLRWWYEGIFEVEFQPPNAELEVLTSAGLVGLVGFVVMCLGGVRVLAAVPPTVGSLGLAVIVARLVQGQLDIFWVAGQSSLPYAIAGICLGVAAREAEQTRRERELVA